jgi:hypothetical protein
MDDDYDELGRTLTEAFLAQFQVESYFREFVCRKWGKVQMTSVSADSLRFDISVTQTLTSQ